MNDLIKDKEIITLSEESGYQLLPLKLQKNNIKTYI
jgi:hypothetical protein